MTSSTSYLQKLKDVLKEDLLKAAPFLLGAVLVRGERRARIVEVEAYRGEDDPGSHAFRGQTPRNRIMFGEAGFAYTYFTYGCHWMLNITALDEGRAGAILIRSAEPLAGLDEMRERRSKAKRDRDLLSGPGKLAAAFDISAKDYGLNLLDPRSVLHLSEGTPPTNIICDTRIGLAQGKGETLPWRFVDAHALRYVSKPHPSI